MDNIWLWLALLAFALGAVAHEKDIYRQCDNEGVAHMWVTANIECRTAQLPDTNK